MTDAEAIQKYAKPGSDQPHTASGGGTTGPYPNSSIQGRVANVMSAGGMSPNAIAGVLQNIRDESSFSPTMRHPDQPRYRGSEAMYAHGLYQEGGPDWQPFQQFLGGRNWQDPSLQTQFMMQHFKQRDPQAWAAMNNAKTPGEAAQIFVDRYLRPAANYRYSRMQRYGRGVPGLSSYFGNTAAPPATAATPSATPSPGFSVTQPTPMGPAQSFRRPGSTPPPARPTATPPMRLPVPDPNQVQEV
jgi:hypothetical protein